MCKKLLLLAFLFTLVFKPEFIFIPHSVNLFFGVIGLLMFFARQRKAKYIIEQSGVSIRTLIGYMIPFVIVSIISVLYNNTSDLYYPRYAISLVLCFFGTYAFASLFYATYGEMSVEKLIDYFVIAECVFLFIGLLSYFSPI